MSLAHALAVAGLLACGGADESVPSVDRALSSALARKEPRPPVTRESLVEDGKHWRLTTPHGAVHV